jgi:hypothetical protein
VLVNERPKFHRLERRAYGALSGVCDKVIVFSRASSEQFWTAL